MRGHPGFVDDAVMDKILEDNGMKREDYDMSDPDGISSLVYTLTEKYLISQNIMKDPASNVDDLEKPNSIAGRGAAEADIGQVALSERKSFEADEQA